MPLVTSKEMLLKAQEGGYAVGAFNAENMEMVKAIIHYKVRYCGYLCSNRCSRS